MPPLIEHSSKTKEDTTKNAIDPSKQAAPKSRSVTGLLRGSRAGGGAGDLGGAKVWVGNGPIVNKVPQGEFPDVDPKHAESREDPSIEITIGTSLEAVLKDSQAADSKASDSKASDSKAEAQPQSDGGKKTGLGHSRRNAWNQPLPHRTLASSGVAGGSSGGPLAAAAQDKKAESPLKAASGSGHQITAWAKQRAQNLLQPLPRREEVSSMGSEGKVDVDVSSPQDGEKAQRNGVPSYARTQGEDHGSKGLLSVGGVKVRKEEEASEDSQAGGVEQKRGKRDGASREEALEQGKATLSVETRPSRRRSNTSAKKDRKKSDCALTEMTPRTRAKAEDELAFLNPVEFSALPPSSIHPLERSWSLWYTRKDAKHSNKTQHYEEYVREIQTVSSVEAFWLVYSHCVRPSSMPPGTDYHFFREGVKPLWEDESNREGGRWLIRLKKCYSDQLWEDLLLAVIGEQFGSTLQEEINGVVIAVRYQEDTLAIWNKSGKNEELKSALRERIKQCLRLPPSTVMEYREHATAPGARPRGPDNSNSADFLDAEERRIALEQAEVLKERFIKRAHEQKERASLGTELKGNGGQQQANLWDGDRRTDPGVVVGEGEVAVSAAAATAGYRQPGSWTSAWRPYRALKFGADGSQAGDPLSATEDSTAAGRGKLRAAALADVVGGPPTVNGAEGYVSNNKHTTFHYNSQDVDFSTLRRTERKLNNQ